MKPRRTRLGDRSPTAWLLLVGSLGFGLFLGARASECPPMDPSLSDYSEQYAPNHSCTVTESWTAPVDLDGDGLTDLLKRRRDAQQRGWWSEQEWAEQRDQIEAFYPEAHVEIWVDSWSRFSVPPGELVGDPLRLECLPPVWPCRAWSPDYPPALPSLQAEGLGIIERYIDRSNCDYGECGWSTHGVLRPEDPNDWTPWPVLVGFRIAQEGAWHLGWMRLEFRRPWPDLRPPYTEIGGVFLTDYIIHPEPETPIAAGEPPRPTLHAEVEADEVVLSWHPAWTDYRLERSPAVTGATWENVPGVENNTVRLPKTGPPAFFHLTQDAAP